MEQEYIVENVDSFNLKDIFECGQCFRWNKEEDGSYSGVFKKNVINVKQKGNKIIFKGICEGNIEEVCRDYFDLDRNYQDIKNKLSKKDRFLKEAISYGDGIRILNQDFWETTISFIISANNNIPRIKKIIENIAKNYGERLEYINKIYYTFPSPKQLSKASVEDLRKMGLGFRDERVYKTTKDFLDGNFKEAEIKELDSQSLHKKLCEMAGVGPKVANCIELFSTLKRFDSFPVDVWVRKVMNELYIKKEDINKVSNTEIQIFAKQKFGSMRGLAQQYLFYWKREQN